MRRPQLRARGAFTLIELLVVIAIIAILIGLLLPAVQKVRDAAARMACSNNLKQLALSCHGYHDSNQKLPPGGQATPPAGGAAFSTSGASYLVYVLPYMEQQPLYNAYDFAHSYDYTGGGSTNPNLKNARPKPFLCPSGIATAALGADAGYDTAHYVGVMGPHGTNPITGAAYPWHTVTSVGGIADSGVLGQDTKVNLLQITDGTSNTLMIGELSWGTGTVVVPYRAWDRGCAPNTGTYGCQMCRNVAYGLSDPSSLAAGNDLAFGSNHTGGANFALADGSVHFFTNSISLNLLMELASKDQGEPVQAP